MAVPEPHASPTASRDRDWKWDGTDKLDDIIEHGGWDAVANAHAWYDEDADDNDPPQLKTAYKLPHHELVDGGLKVNWSGVTAAMNVVQGGRGGVDLPEDEIDDVYEHLARHYREFDEEPPER
ncbi:MAG: hypothetical protein KY461_14410 [Actinobacteria bacterium]|nr:hypothetical protein [Actinomycetota bacterium]